MRSQASCILIRSVDEPNPNLPARQQDAPPIELEFEVVDGPGVEDAPAGRVPHAAGGPFGDLPAPQMIAEALRLHRRNTLFRWLRHTVIIGGLLLILIFERIAWARTVLVFYSILAALSLFLRLKLIGLNHRVLHGLSGIARGPGRPG